MNWLAPLPLRLRVKVSPALAGRLVNELRDVAESATEMDDFESLIADYGSLFNQPAVYH